MIFTPNGVVTRETCPGCHTLDVKVEHGRDDEDHRHCHLWHCPKCGKSLARVLYNCEHCSVTVKTTTLVNGIVEGLRFEEEPATPNLINVLLPKDDSCQMLWQEGALVGFAIAKTLFEDWFRLHRQWRRDNHHHLLGKTCRGCGTPVDDRSDYCKEHNPRKRGKKVEDVQ